jgi:tRNA G37 N-methylase Trm5
MRDIAYIIKNALGQSHDIIRKVVSQGDIVVDATAGNGNDTVMLAELVGSTGKVYSFDIQEKAIINTKNKLIEKGYLDRVVLINDGHQNIDRYVGENIKAVMFNLGYLPGGDHSIATKGETTAQAISKALDLVEVHGLVCIVVYYGGDSGFDEKEYLDKFIRGIDSRKYTVMKTEFVNQLNCPPILVCIERLC